MRRENAATYSAVVSALRDPELKEEVLRTVSATEAYRYITRYGPRPSPGRRVDRSRGAQHPRCAQERGIRNGQAPAPLSPAAGTRQFRPIFKASCSPKPCTFR